MFLFLPVSSFSAGLGVDVVREVMTDVFETISEKVLRMVIVGSKVIFGVADVVLDSRMLLTTLAAIGAPPTPGCCP